MGAWKIKEIVQDVLLKESTLSKVESRTALAVNINGILSSLLLYLSRQEWVKILKWFLRWFSTAAISQETGIHPLRILHALTKLPIAMSKDIPKIFSAIIEVDETYILF